MQAAVLLLACVFFVVPVLPAMPELGVDSSWAQAVLHAVSQGLFFGQDVVFPYGPYAFLQANSYAPDTYWLGVGWGLLVAGWLFWSLWRMREVGAGEHRHVGLWVLALLGLSDLHAFYLCAPFLFLSSALAADRIWKSRWEEDAYFGLSMLVMALATLCKTSNAMPVLPVFLALAWVSWRRSLGALAGYGVSLALLWVLLGQRFADVPAYLLGGLDLISGYSMAMNLTGPWLGVAAFCVACVAWVAGFRGLWDKKHLALLFGGLVTLWLLGKSSFVRQDVHALIGATGLVRVGLATFSRSWWAHRRGGGVMICGAVVLAGSYHVPHSLERYKASVAGVNSGAEPATFADQAAHRLVRGFEPHLALVTGGKAGLDRLWREARREVKAAKPLPAGLAQPIDVYPVDIGTVLAHDYQWHGRPVLQSYSVYTSRLANLDEKHLVSEGAPATVIFIGSAIDGQLTSLGDGPSWLTILQRYVPNPEQSGIWARRKQVQTVPLLGVRQFDTTCGAEWGLGDMAPGTALFARIDMQPTTAGRLAAFLFRVPESRIELTFTDGTKQRYRFVPAMAREGFMLSPHVAEPADFSRILKAGELPSVRSVRLFGKGCEWLYAAKIPVVLEIRDLPDAGD